MICRFLLVAIAIFFISNTSFAIQYGAIDQNSILFDYKKLNCSAPESHNLFLNKASEQYYVLTKVDNARIEPYIQLGRIYDEKNKEPMAHENFCRALNLNCKDARANFYYGEFFFKRCEYKKALYYYNIAYNNGYKNQYILNLRLATIYEKFADLSNAKKFYDVSYSMKPSDKLREKISSINVIDYQKSEYYRE